MNSRLKVKRSTLKELGYMMTKIKLKCLSWAVLISVIDLTGETLNASCTSFLSAINLNRGCTRKQSTYMARVRK